MKSRLKQVILVGYKNCRTSGPIHDFIRLRGPELKRILQTELRYCCLTTNHLHAAFCTHGVHQKFYKAQERVASRT